MARILILESNAEVRQLLALQVRHLGHEAVCGGEGTGAAGGAAIDAAIVEPVAPGGLDAARVLRNVWPHLPLVFVSVRPPSAESRSLAPVLHLVKPVRLAELEAALAAALNRALP